MAGAVRSMTHDRRRYRGRSRSALRDASAAAASPDAALARTAATTERIATHDGLTGLPNRLLFQQRAAAALDLARRDDAKLAVLLLDLDQFKEVNDTPGHEQWGQTDRRSGGAVAERALRRLPTRLRGSAATSSCSSRSSRMCPRRTRSLACSTPPRSRSCSIIFGCMCAVAAWICSLPDDGGDTETLLRKADVAMYAAKELQGPVAYSADHDHYLAELARSAR